MLRDEGAGTHPSEAGEKMHLSNTGGYYFPGSPTLNVVRETRTGAWSDINTGGSTAQVTRTYATI